MNISRDKRVLVDHRDGTACARTEFRVLVERTDEDEWAPVPLEDRVVGNDEMQANFGLWEDTEISTGHLFWKKVQRPKDGKVDADEVTTVAEIASRPADLRATDRFPSDPDWQCYDRSSLHSVELHLTPEGGSLLTEWSVDKTLTGYPYIMEHRTWGHPFLGPGDWY